MKDKFSKFISLIKKYGIIKTIRKVSSYVISKLINILHSLNFIRNRKVAKLIDEILRENNYDRIIIWRSNFGWNVPLFQRPQHISLNLSKQKCLVFYEVTNFTDKIKNIKKVNKNLILINLENRSIQKILFNKLQCIEKPKYIQIYSTDWNMKVEELKQYIQNGYKIIYEYIDEINPILSGTKEIPVNIKEKYEYMLSDKENIFVVVTADKLKEDIEKKRGREKLVFACNGVDYEHYQNIDKEFEFDKEFKQILSQNKPIIGYYGAFASWFDYKMVKKLAKKRPQYNIVLIGIKYDETLEQSRIQELNNVYFLGSRDYKILKNYANKFDVCTVPFIINDITKATSPLKIFEYMALGKPIVTTAMNECKKYKSIYIANNNEEFVEMIDKTIKLNKSEHNEYFKILEEEALQNTWQNKVKEIVQFLNYNEIRNRDKKTNRRI